MQPKILVGCPTSFHKEYALDEYAKAVKSLTYNNYDILLVDNSQDNIYFDKIKQKGLPVIKGPYFEGALDRIIASRNILKEYVLKNNYDYFFSLEQDLIPPINILESLLRHKKRVITAVYFNYVTKGNETRLLPVIWTGISNNLRYLIKPHQLKKGLLRIAIAGLGCILIHKTVLAKIKFRYEKKEEAFDDVYFALDCKKHNIPIYADTNLISKHLIKNRPYPWEKIRK